jgi:hypothetical protein
MSYELGKIPKEVLENYQQGCAKEIHRSPDKDRFICYTMKSPKLNVTVNPFSAESPPFIRIFNQLRNDQRIYSHPCPVLEEERGNFVILPPISPDDKLVQVLEFLKWQQEK